MSNFTPEQIQEILDLYFENFAHRQYIGARYVPIFGRKGETSIEWDNSAPYEPLTIVLHEGNSYTSRQFVPTGVAITNTAYWAETGNFNAQVEQYRQEVLSYESRISAIEDALPSTAFDSDNTVSDAINAINNEIGEGFSPQNTIKDTVDSIADVATRALNRGRTFVLIGDSYGSDDPTPDTGWTGWTTRMTNILDRQGITCKAKSQGGGAFCADATHNFLEILQSVVNTMTNDEKEDCSVVLIGGGANDMNKTAEDINTGVLAVCNYVRANLPNARMYLSCFGYSNKREYFSSGKSRQRLCVETYFKYQSAARLYGIAFDTGSVFTLNSNSLFWTDGIHPSDTGKSVIASRMINFVLCGNKYTLPSSITNYVDPLENISVNYNNETLNYTTDPNSLKSDIYISHVGGITFNYTNPINYANNSAIQLGKCVIPGISGVTHIIPVAVNMVDTSSNLHNGNGTLVIDESASTMILRCTMQDASITVSSLTIRPIGGSSVVYSIP